MMWLLWIGVVLAGPHVVVRTGDDLAAIAERWGTTEAELRRLNQLPDGQPKVGTLLNIPGQVEPALLTGAHGDVRVTTPGRAEAPGIGGDELPVGTVVCTGEDGYATVRLASTPGGGHDEITLLPGTCLTIAGTSGKGARRSSLLNIAAGSITVRDATDERGDVIVQSESGVTSGSGGGFRVSVESNAARTEAVTDPVAVMAQGGEVAVGAGEGSRTRTGEIPGAPVKLLLAPALTTPLNQAVLTSATFGWESNPVALGYRFAAATDRELAFIVYSTNTETSAWRPTLFELPADAGAWWWTIEAIDRDGFVGLPATARCFTAPPGVAAPGGTCGP